MAERLPLAEHLLCIPSAIPRVAMKITDEERIKESEDYRPKFGIGSALDETRSWEKPPTFFSGATFHELDYEQVHRFMSMTDEEKFEYGFWAELKSSSRGFYWGLGLGIVLGMIFLVILARS